MWQIKVCKAGVVVCVALALSGCGTSWMAFRDGNPIIEDYAGSFFSDNFGWLFSKHNMYTFATKASHRMVLIKENKENKDGANRMISCAEPSPDVAEAFASALAAELKVAVAGKAEGDAKLAHDVATQVAPLLFRTQGIQLYRDEMHKLCIDRMNGWVTDGKTYDAVSDQTMDKAIELIKFEVPHMTNVMIEYFKSVRATGPRNAEKGEGTSTAAK